MTAQHNRHRVARFLRDSARYLDIQAGREQASDPGAAYDHAEQAELMDQLANEAEALDTETEEAR